MYDFVRIACAVPAVRVGDVKKNTQDICAYMEKADAQNVDILVFPELAMTGYTCQDLFFQETLINAVKEGLHEISLCSAAHPNLAAVVGMPLRIGAKIYNCAAVFVHGEICGIVPKTHLPNYNEFYEKRWFAHGNEIEGICLRPQDLGLPCGEDYWMIPVGARQVFAFGETRFAIEICEDLWTPQPPSAALAVGGAEIILNLSASNELIGKRAYRRHLVCNQSAACSCVYAYCSAGCTESTQDLIFSGQSLIALNGSLLCETEKAIATDYMMVCDCDLGRIHADRSKKQYYTVGKNVTLTEIAGDPLRSDGSLYRARKLPFVPSQKHDRAERCMEIFNMQVAGLKHRLETIGAKAVIGVSGGLDSTLALLVTVEAMKELGRSVSDVHAITMPCFGTTDRTHTNSWKLMQTLGVTAKEIPVNEAVTLHFRDIGHDQTRFDGTYENSQARERTQILMDYAGSVGGIVIGTGDLSELALGWCTYNGDQMSMYGVNSTIPKTLLRWMIEALAEHPDFAAAHDLLADILDTPISPELLPPGADGEIAQYTEDLVGPYALHDFFLYYMLRFGYTPTKIYMLACRAFEGDFDAETIKKWMQVFYRRFFTQQFKRSCMPDGVKVGSVALSPRGDWRMPSDASGRIWLDEIEKL